MGCVAAKRRGDPAKDLLVAIDFACREAIKDGHEPEYQVVSHMLYEALENPETRLVLLLGLSQYLCRSVRGCPPDLRFWQSHPDL